MMQRAKDSFFAALRDRLAVVNSERTVLIDGQTRPGILVCENEVAGLDEKSADVFCVTWGACNRVSPDSGPVAIECKIAYRTAGSDDGHGMDRGRKLAAMDDELGRMLSPRHAPKMDFANNDVAALNGNVFWSNAIMSAAEKNGRFLRREVTLKVHFHPEVQS